MSLYKFKYDNVSLRDYLKERRFAGELKRREAEALKREAAIIDDECHQLERALLPAEEDKEKP